MFRSVAALALLLVPLTAQAQGGVHRVAPGETLWAIAGQHYGAPWRWQEIHEANRDVVEDPHRIYPDEELTIPSLAPGIADAPSAPDVHLVAQGETLWAIAERHYGTPWRWQAIHQANPDVVEDPHWIYPGEVLTIPGAGPGGRLATGPVVDPTPEPLEPATTERRAAEPPDPQPDPGPTPAPEITQHLAPDSATDPSRGAPPDVPERVTAAAAEPPATPQAPHPDPATTRPPRWPPSPGTACHRTPRPPPADTP